MAVTWICPTCDADSLHCIDCGEPFNKACKCVKDSTEAYCLICTGVFEISPDDEDLVDSEPVVLECVCDPPKQYCCTKCEVRRNKPEDPWEEFKGTVGTYQRCRHYGQEVVFDNKVKVLASSEHDHLADSAPDWGLYADYIWRPKCRAEFIDWPDFGLPKNYEAAANAIIYAYDCASEGWAVEVGCIGGHGRTGTILGCMAVITGVHFDDAEAWVHENYCKEAIETDEQAWWIKWFACYYFGWDLPTDKPVGWTTTSYSNYRVTTTVKTKDGWVEKMPVDPNVKHSPHCECDDCRYKKLGFGALSDSKDKEFADEVIGTIQNRSLGDEAIAEWKRVVELTGSKDAANKIAAQRVTGHFPVYRADCTLCDSCNELWPCAASSEKHNHQYVVDGTESGDWIWKTGDGWVWKQMFSENEWKVLFSK